MADDAALGAACQSARVRGPGHAIHPTYALYVGRVLELAGIEKERNLEQLAGWRPYRFSSEVPPP